jgi:hypothetical protein
MGAADGCDCDSDGLGSSSVPDGSAGFSVEVTGFTGCAAGVAAEPPPDDPVFLLSDGEEQPAVMAKTPARIGADQRNDQEKFNRIGCLLRRIRLRSCFKIGLVAQAARLHARF